MTRLPDNRVEFYWDAKGNLTKSYSHVLQLAEGRAAWDVYLVFDRTAEWNTEPPVPKFWRHQLRGLPSEHRLDGDQLAKEINGLLQQKK